MSVLMTLRLSGDAKLLEALTQKDPTIFPTVSARAKTFGLISHHFYATDDEVLVVDEWPDQESFQAFFDASPEIPVVMQEAGATGQPDITYWRRLDLGDDVG